MAKTTRTSSTRSRKSGGEAVNAETMATRQRDISVSEFFAKNRHLLGFDNPRKALLTTIKEAVDNALDACEEAGILPDILVKIDHLPEVGENRYRVTIEDNGPGIVRKQVENIFGRLLYGSKFHRLKMSRGQQGIGISAAGMYGLMTTGRPMEIVTRPKKGKPAHHIVLAMDTTKNRPEVTTDEETEDFPDHTGTRVTIELEARYSKGKTSVDEYLEQTGIANPHAKITYIPPRPASSKADEATAKAEALAFDDSADPHAPIVAGEGQGEGRGEGGIVRTEQVGDAIIHPRTVDELPAETTEIRPHPYGVELGTFIQMLAKSEEKQLGGFLKNDFCRITPTVAGQVYKRAGVTGQTWLKTIDHAAAEKIYKTLQEAKLRAPPTDCLSPIGVRQMLAGLLKGVKAEFYAASTRSPAVYRGNPFQIEAAIAYGGQLPADDSARVIRFANRVPLLYQPSACCSFKSVVETGWRNYNLSQPRGALPVGPLVIMIHMASVWVPFTSESKEAIADYDEIRKEMKLALQECGRKLGTYLRRRQKMKREGERRDVFQRYIGEIAKACEALTGTEAAQVYEALLKQAKRRTEIADAVLDDEGKIVSIGGGGNGRLDDDDGVIIVDADGTGPTGGGPAGGSAAPEDDDDDGGGGGGGRGKGKGAKKKRRRAPAGDEKPRRDKPKPESNGTAPRKTPGKGKPRMRLSPSGGLFEV